MTFMTGASVSSVGVYKQEKSGRFENEECGCQRGIASSGLDFHLFLIVTLDRFIGSSLRGCGIPLP